MSIFMLMFCAFLQSQNTVHQWPSQKAPVIDNLFLHTREVLSHWKGRSVLNHLCGTVSTLNQPRKTRTAGLCLHKSGFSLYRASKLLCFGGCSLHESQWNRIPDPYRLESKHKNGLMRIHHPGKMTKLYTFKSGHRVCYERWSSHYWFVFFWWTCTCSAVCSWHYPTPRALSVHRKSFFTILVWHRHSLATHKKTRCRSHVTYHVM